MKVANYKKYRYFDYPDYLGNVPTEMQYELGDIVYIKPTNSIGVVIGCIDGESEELRTDAEGMQSFSDLVLATNVHFQLKNVSVSIELKAEVKTRE